MHFLKSVQFVIFLAFFTIQVSVANAQTKNQIYCERNQIEANKQVEIALENKKNEKRTAAAAAAAIGCSLLSIAVLGFDLGTTAATCISVAALTYGALTIAETRKITRETYERFRDPKCRSAVAR